MGVSGPQPTRQALIAISGVVLLWGVTVAMTLHAFSHNATSYALALAALVAAIGMLGYRAGSLSVRSAPAWLCVAVLLCAYVLKVILVALDPESAVRMGSLPRLVHGGTPIGLALYDAMLLAAVCCAPMCVVFSLLLAKSKPQPVVAGAENEPLRVLIFLLAISACASLFSAWIALRYQVGLMGVHVTEVLPFRLRGLIYYFRMVALPGMLLYAIYSAHRRRSMGWVLVGAMLLIGNGAVDAVAKTSRSALLLPILSLLFLFVVAGYRVRLRYVIVLAALLLLILIALPYVGSMRLFRQQGLDLESAAMAALSATDFHPLGSLEAGVRLVLYRIPGYEQLVGILGHGIPPLGASVIDRFQSELGVAGYLTVEGYLFPAGHPHLSAPGFVGWWYLVGGWPMAAFGGMVAAVFVHFSWSGLLRLHFRSSVVARVFFLLLLWGALTEGTLDSLGKMFVAMLGSVLMLEMILQLAHWLAGGDEGRSLVKAPDGR